MNPNIKKKFILEAWDYNLSLVTPFSTSYISDNSYYSKNNYISFQEPVEQTYSIKNYHSLVEKFIAAEINEPNAKKLLLKGDSFLIPYFKYFFVQNKELQLDLLKFYNSFFNYNFKTIDFLKDFENKKIETFLTNVNYWLDYSTKNIIDLNSFMLEKSFNEGFKVSILKKYVEKNLKTINKNPILSKYLEDFLTQNYPQELDLIATNVVAIKSRFNSPDIAQYEKSFNKSTVYCITDNLLLDNLLKTFQISGWANSSYQRAVSIYHTYLEDKYDFKIHSLIPQNQKNIEFFIKMKNSEFTLIDYKKDLMNLLSFYKSNPELSLTKENLDKLFFNQKLNDSLMPTLKKQKYNKI